MTVTVKNKTKTPLVVPPSVRRKAGHRNGEDLEFRVSGGVITIIPKFPPADDEYTPVERRTIDRALPRAKRPTRKGAPMAPLKLTRSLSPLWTRKRRGCAGKNVNARRDD